MNKNTIFAVVGVSTDENKYGYKVFKHLLDSNYKVFGINPKATEILNQKIYKNITEINQKIDWVIFVLPPEIGEKILQDVINLDIKNVWLQPGAENEKLIQICKDNNINYISNACIIKNNPIQLDK
ncbi:MAG: CoA-binding protein [Patescibacteria group bacterium]|nr:CoA-binding protein [Patescibacteria group bacterium]MDD4304044.1 CoA-binding protein [Patescibacteria group bacterium]MDD4694921.1 CoA-binding protein [Patescibacteria group bacterium]